MGSVSNVADDAAWVRVIALYAQVERELSKVLLHQHGLGLSDYRALCYLSTAAGGELRIQELTDLVGLNESSVSRLVARLERSGLVKRDICADDRRGVYTLLTDKGRQQHIAAKPLYEQTLSQALTAAQADPRLEELVTAIRRYSIVG